MGTLLVFRIIGGFFIALALWYAVRRMNCRVEITGRFISHNIVSSKGVKQYSPVFHYVINGVEYEQKSMEAFSKKKAAKYVPGECYRLYVNESNPNMIVVSKMPQSEWLFAFLGVFAMIMGCLPS